MKIILCDLIGLTYDGSTLNKRGLGGSESAVILISKELSRLDNEVIVLNNCKSSDTNPGYYDDVRYVDHSDVVSIDLNSVDIFISSRTVAPFWANHTHSKIAYSAKKRILWMHDTFAQGEQDLEAMVVGGYIDEIFTLSDFHTNYVLNSEHGHKRNFEVLKHKIWQTRNGAVKYIDEVDTYSKDPNLFVYNASVTKGLRPLLEHIWPEVIKIIPNAKLKVIGGYYRFREGSQPDQQELALNEYKDRDYKNVHFTGIIKQSEIAKILSKASFMLYPTEFPETFGISSLESLLYKTPLITCRFGALEETAIDLCCYKINYSTTKNSLSPDIDEKNQYRLFVNEVINAHSNRYLLQQKQNYCDILDHDIYSWESVATEWSEHFYNILSQPCPVQLYRKASMIRDRVSRVFGRRFSNVETIKSYRKYSTCRNNKLCIVTPFWNSEKYIKKCIQSVAAQDYENYEHFLIDDCSDDNSYNIAKETILSLPKDISKKFHLTRNDKNSGAIYNQLKTISNLKDDDVICLLDGDDWLVNNNTIFNLYDSLYSDENVDFTYGSMWSLADNIPLIAQTYPKKVLTEKGFKKHLFNWNIPYTHFRTFRKNLINNLDHNIVKTDVDTYMKAGADSPLFYHLIENAKNPKAVKDIIYIYNDLNPLNDYKIRSIEQNENATRCLG